MAKITDIGIEAGTGAQQQREMPASTELTSWIMTRVSDWEDHRRTNFDKRWDEYYRLWRGIFSTEDKSRDTERSKLIHPALSQAVESAVSELEQATFGNGKWFDVSDDVLDQEPADIAMWRDQMEEDLDKEDVEGAFSESFLNGALYGTAIGKIVLEERVEKKIVPVAIGDSTVLTPEVEEQDVVRVGIVAVHPKEFVIDPAARTIDDALGMAHITDVPKHEVQRKQTTGIYRDVVLSGYNDSIVGSNNNTSKPDIRDLRENDRTKLIEYHGFVPKNLLTAYLAEKDEDSKGFAEEILTDDDDTLVEAIITIANGGTLLRAVENPFIMGDRCFIAYQHDTVPNRFWGRGVCEKGYNPQKGLDAEMRGRIDAMALSIHPMMGIDATRLMRGTNFKIAPGKSILTNGAPGDVLMPFNFGQVNPTTFSQSADLERQVQMATGSMDSATPVGDARRNETLGGMSIIQGGSVKRTRRTMANIERKFTKPFLHKAAWRFMQFAPERYPVEDMKFNVHSTLGIQARELEQQQLGALMNSVPSDSPAFWLLLKGIFEHSDLSNREQMLEVIDQMTEASLARQLNPQPDPLIAVQMKEIEVKAQIDQLKLQQKDDIDNKEIQLDIERLELERAKLQLRAQEIAIDARIALAGQEQDSMVTAVQMSASREDSQLKAAIQLAGKNKGDAS